MLWHRSEPAARRVTRRPAVLVRRPDDALHRRVDVLRARAIPRADSGGELGQAAPVPEVRPRHPPARGAGLRGIRTAPPVAAAPLVDVPAIQGLLGEPAPAARADD